MDAHYLMLRTDRLWCLHTPLRPYRHIEYKVYGFSQSGLRTKTIRKVSSLCTYILQTSFLLCRHSERTANQLMYSYYIQIWHQCSHFLGLLSHIGIPVARIKVRTHRQLMFGKRRQLSLSDRCVWLILTLYIPNCLSNNVLLIHIHQYKRLKEMPSKTTLHFLTNIHTNIVPIQWCSVYHRHPSTIKVKWVDDTISSTRQNIHYFDMIILCKRLFTCYSYY